MNRVYKVIWSKAKHCYVVTSEIARSVTKSASSARSAGRKGAAVLAMAALLFTAGGMLGEAATPVVTDVTANETGNMITVTKDVGGPTTITINNVVHATTADRATKDANGVVIDRNYVKNADAEVEAGGTYVKVDNTVGQNLSALDTNLSALDTQVKANADAVAAEATARKAADQNNLKVGDDGVISKVSNDGTTPSAVKTLVLKVDGDNQITMDEKGIKVGLNSGVMDKDGFYAGGDDYEHAGAALKWDGSIKGAGGKFTVDKDGSIKGADGKFTVDKDGNAAIGGTLTVDKNLTVNGTFDSKTLSSKLGENNYTTINGGKTESMNLKVDAVGTETKASSSTFDENGSSAWAKDDESIGKSSMTADKISQSLSDIGDHPQNKASRELSQNEGNKYEITDSVVEGNQSNVENRTADTTDSQISLKDDRGKVLNKSYITQNLRNIHQGIQNGAKSSTVNQTETGIKSTATDGKKTASTNLSNGGFNTYATDGKNKTYTKQTATDIKNTAENGTISNSAKDLVNTATGDINNTAKNRITNKALDVETDAKSSIVNKVSNEYGSNTSTQLSYQTTEEMSRADGKTASYLRGAAEEKSQLTDGAKKTTIDTIAGQTNTNITDGKNISNNLQKADQVVSLVTDGTNITVVNQDAKSLASSITDGTRVNNTISTVDTSVQRIQTDDTHYSVSSKSASKMEDALVSGSTVIDSLKDAEKGLVSTAVTDGRNRTGSTMTAEGITNSAAESIVNEIGDGSKVKSEMTAKGITNTAKDGTITNDAKDVFNKGTNSVINEVGNNQVAVTTDSVKAAYGSDTSTTWDAKGITSATSGDMKNSAKNISNSAAEKLSNSAAEIENTATKSITDKVGKNTSWEMTDGKVVESVKDESGKTNQTTTTAADTYQFVKNGDNTLAKRTSSTNDNLNITDGTNTYTKITTATGNKQTVTDGAETASTNLTKSASNTLIENGTQSVLDHMAADTSYTVMNEKGNGSRRQQTASEILDRVTDGTDTSEVKQTASEVAISSKNITNTADTIKDVAGKTTVITTDSGTTFENTDKKDKVTFMGKEKSVDTKETTISGNTITTGEAIMDYANVTKDLSVEGDATVDKDLTVKGTSEFVGRADFRNDVYVDENLTVAKETRTDTLYVDHDGYVGGNLNVDGNIETHDAVLSADSRQVVTGRQLYQTNERVDRLDNRIKKVGANAAALAALRPGDFNPDDKFSIAAGFGSYRNANAAALGLFYRPNENVLLSLGTSFGDGENMVNAGVSVKFGRGKSMAERRKEMADEVSSMRDEMRSQDERIAELEEMLKKQSELIEKLSKES